MSTQHSPKKERQKIYFDCICGAVCSISALIGILFFTKGKILYSTHYIISLSFWIGYLAFSLFMIGLGIYKHYQDKSFNPDAIPKKKLKTPKVS